MSMIEFRYGNDLDLDQVIELYHASTLGERRPVNDRQAMADMIRHANLVVTAWDGDLLVGIARTLTDFSERGGEWIPVNSGYQLPVSLYCLYSLSMKPL
jgi:hypothetical protein